MFRFDFESTHKILKARLEHRVMDEELTASYRLATEHVRRISPRALIADFSAVTSCEVVPSTVNNLAKLPPILLDDSAAHFIVAPSIHAFELSRAFETRARQIGPRLYVVRTMAEVRVALALLLSRN
jgi:hypothetical protein